TVIIDMHITLCINQHGKHLRSKHQPFNPCFFTAINTRIIP
ncbi:MAG: hypothetical protein ACI8ZO_000585, partial [Flavobacteriales bacterium]